MPLKFYAADRTVSAEELNSMGMDKLRAGNNIAAAGYFRKAITVDPSRKIYYNNLAAAYIRLEDYYKAEGQLLTAIAIDPDYTKALSNMSYVMFKTGRYSEAYSYYLRAKNSDPSYTEKRFERGRVLARLREQSLQNPDDKNLKKIILYLESKGE